MLRSLPAVVGARLPAALPVAVALQQRRWRSAQRGPGRRQQPVTCRKGPWRPTLDDVTRISEGKAAKQRGTGSREVPHRLNAEERKLYDFALQKGFLTLKGSGYRRERKGSPLANIYRQWCDAQARPAVLVEQGTAGTAGGDTVLVDLSPLRLPLGSARSSQYKAACMSIAVEQGCHGPLPESQQQSPFTVLVPQSLLRAPLDDLIIEEGGSSSSGGSGGGGSKSRSAAAASAAAVEGGSAPGPSSGAAAHTNSDTLAAGAAAQPVAAAGAAALTGAEAAARGVREELRLGSAIWQQEPQLLCFPCERAAAKALAKALAEQLGPRARQLQQEAAESEEDEEGDEEEGEEEDEEEEGEESLSAEASPVAAAAAAVL